MSAAITITLVGIILVLLFEDWIMALARVWRDLSSFRRQ